MADIKIYQERRNRLAARMKMGVAIIPTATEYIRNNDTHFPFRFDSTFHYLTGFSEPESVLILVAGDAPKSVLFCRDKDVEREIWDGFRFGPEAARETFGFDQTYSINEIDDAIPTLLADQPALFFAIGANKEWDGCVVSWLNKVRERSRSGITAPGDIKDPRVFLDEMRLYKDETEVATLRRAAAISDVAHRSAMRCVRPGMKEYEIEAELLYEFRRAGSQAPAYPSIVAGGANACVLHYIQNDAVLRDGDLLLIDAGCEYNGYASDITRTFPVNGKFSPIQKDVYQVVLHAQIAAIKAAKPGNEWETPHNEALKVLAQGFVDLGLCNGSVDAVIESGAYKKYYMHRTGHWLGMDVHDVGEYKTAGAWRTLQADMVFTVEPGCYIRPDKDVPEVFWNIGIRIEDDVVIRPDGCEVLTSATPKTVEAIEELMSHD